MVVSQSEIRSRFVLDCKTGEIGFRGDPDVAPAGSLPAAATAETVAPSFDSTRGTPNKKPKTAPVTLTPSAISKVKEIMASQNPVPMGLRLSVQGGGCSGFQYSMAFENGAGMMDKVFEMDGLKLFVDATSLMYLAGANVDYLESLEGAGFKFENPNVKSTCGCGSSFQA